jgi:DNA-directed RNA polymerase subunit RPC12/RpoP
LDSIDAYILSRSSLIVRQRKALLPVVKERQAIADSFIRNLQILGLDRIKPPAPTLADIFAKHAAEKAATASPTQQSSVPAIAAQRPASQEMPRVPATPTGAKVAPSARVVTPAEDPAGHQDVDDFGNPWEPDAPKLFVCSYCKSEFYEQEPQQKCRWCGFRVVRKEEV